MAPSGKSKQVLRAPDTSSLISKLSKTRLERLKNDDLTGLAGEPRNYDLAVRDPEASSAWMYEHQVYVRLAYCIPSCILYVLVLIALNKERKGPSGRFYSLLMVQAILIWKYGFPSSVAITLLTPFISVHPLLYHHSWFRISKHTGCFEVTSTANIYILMTQLLIFMTVLLATTSAVNIVSVTLLFIRSKRHQDKAERNMSILALLDFFIQVSFYVLYVIIYEEAGNAIAGVLVPYASDLLTFSNAYLLIILNKKIRHRVVRYAKCRGKNGNQIALQVIPSVDLVTAHQS
ncbi:Serpentine receptor class gamma [Trichostrongylus colubriformis]|uniref:Serpentine receptor class gamma n=1 Tax=Trichostrongylus colubriformis TaxID=6319 RepID=A0AAN8FT06_TRICO